MRKLFILFLFLPIAMVRGQSTDILVSERVFTNSPAVQTGSSNVEASILSDPLSLELSRQIRPSAIEPLQPKPNEMMLGKVKASGIAIEITKTKRPFGVLDPFSPPPNSSSFDNFDHYRKESGLDQKGPNQDTLKENGLKVFSIHF